jgi:hypothetical protein
MTKADDITELDEKAGKTSGKRSKRFVITVVVPIVAVCIASAALLTNKLYIYKKVKKAIDFVGTSDSRFEHERSSIVDLLNKLDKFKSELNKVPPDANEKLLRGRELRLNSGKQLPVNERMSFDDAMAIRDAELTLRGVNNFMSTLVLFLRTSLSEQRRAMEILGKITPPAEVKEYAKELVDLIGETQLINEQILEEAHKISSSGEVKEYIKQSEKFKNELAELKQQATVFLN